MSINTRPGELWGRQYPFERNNLQRAITLISLSGVLAVTVLFLIHGDVAQLFGISLVGGGVVSALAAISRHRYVRETRLGFGILKSRGGQFVLGSALMFAVVGGLVLLLILIE